MGIDINTALVYRDNGGKFHRVLNFHRGADGEFSETPLPYFRNSFFFGWLMDHSSADSLKTFMMDAPDCLTEWHESYSKFAQDMTTTTLWNMTECLAGLEKLLSEKRKEKENILSSQDHTPSIEFNTRLLDALSRICADQNCDPLQATQIVEQTRKFLMDDYKANGTLTDLVTDIEYEIAEYEEHRDVLEMWIENIKGYAYTWFEGAQYNHEIGYSEFNPNNLYVWYCFDI